MSGVSNSCVILTSVSHDKKLTSQSRNLDSQNLVEIKVETVCPRGTAASVVSASAPNMFIMMTEAP